MFKLVSRLGFPCNINHVDYPRTASANVQQLARLPNLIDAAQPHR